MIDVVIDVVIDVIIDVVIDVTFVIVETKSGWSVSFLFLPKEMKKDQINTYHVNMLTQFFI